jgi:cold shock CspA family protein
VPPELCPPCTLPPRPPAVFVHQSVIQSTGFRYLKEGEKVSPPPAAHDATSSQALGRRSLLGDGHGRGDVRPARPPPSTRLTAHPPATAITRPALASQVSFEVKSSDKGVQAENVRDLDGRPFERVAGEGEPRQQQQGGGGAPRQQRSRGPRRDKSNGEVPLA